ncbi:hypothetical protein [Dysosmobacter sp.]|uniref:hypothetical protein n=1 Tax=Dysosmobacter sp. TaxID=2591382 RepID=UPI002672E707|nr:hypothetical protein [Dysosmobacter sp.]MCI7282663.1 hypothetical protein [Dysosmobacter sp.]
MDRLTKYSNETSHKNGVCCTHFLSDECRALGGECAHGCKWEEAAWERLAAYEDTGLTPQEVLSMKFEWCAMMDALNSIGGGYTRLRELAEADRAGRLVVLPFNKALTNADRIRAATNQQLAKLLYDNQKEFCRLMYKNLGFEGELEFSEDYSDILAWLNTSEKAEKALEAKRDGSTSM